MASKICRKDQDTAQKQKVVPLISRETSFGQNVSELVFGDNIFDLDLVVQVGSVKQPVKSNTVSSRHMSHRETSSFDCHFDDSFIVFKNVQLRLIVRRMCVCGYVIHLTQLVSLLFSGDMLGHGFGIKNYPSFLVASMFGLSFVFWLNVRLQPRDPKDQDQVTDPYVVQHPEK